MTEGNFNIIDKCYEYHWSLTALNVSQREEQRIKETISIIPDENCSSVLDLGCGDGRITNRLPYKSIRVVGLDGSEEALKHVKTEKLLGSVNCLPFPNMSFDLILCCEVLEHLPFNIYPQTLKEMERVASKYIIITVPNNEHLKGSLVTCPYCSCLFNPYRHVRAFKEKDLKELFSRFRLHTLKPCLPVEKYPDILLRGLRLLKFIPGNLLPPTALCSQCGYTPPIAGEKSHNKNNIPTNNVPKGSSLIRLLNLLARLSRYFIPKMKKDTYLMALYQRIVE